MHRRTLGTVQGVKNQIIIHNQVFILVSVVYYLFCSSSSSSVSVSAAECRVEARAV